MGSNKKSCGHEEEEPTETVWDHWVKKRNGSCNLSLIFYILNPDMYL